MNILLDATVGFNEPWFCSNGAPTPSELASIFNLVGQFGSKIFRIGADVIKIFNFSIASNWGFCKLKATSFFKSTRTEIVYHSQKSL